MFESRPQCAVRARSYTVGATDGLVLDSAESRLTMPAGRVPGGDPTATGPRPLAPPTASPARSAASVVCGFPGRSHASRALGNEPRRPDPDGGRLHIAVLVKQVPRFEEIAPAADGRLLRDGVEPEMNPYCRRAVAQAAILASDAPGSEVTVFTLGPPAADDVLREAISWICESGSPARGVHICGPEFAGSDTLATAAALAAALRREGPFDLVLAGRNSIDADTGQVGPQLAQLLGLPFATGVRELALSDGSLHVQCEHDDGWLRAELPTPAVLSVAERLCAPAKVDPDGREAVASDLIRTVSGAQLGPGPWGAAAANTAVGQTRVIAETRLGLRTPDDPLPAQVNTAVRVLLERGALGTHGAPENADPVPESSVGAGDAITIAVIVEPDREHLTREILGEAASLSAPLRGHVVALAQTPEDPAELGRWGADEVVQMSPRTSGNDDSPPTPLVEEDVARAIITWCTPEAPWAMLTPSTSWGREVASRVAAALGAGLTGDAIGFEEVNGRLVSWKPAFGGQVVVAVTAGSSLQMATVRAGTLRRRTPRTSAAATTALPVAPRSRVHVLSRDRDDDPDRLAAACAVVGVGQAVQPSEYPELHPLLDALGAELGATRKVTDAGWLPRSRQIGITGRSIAPRVFVSIGARGSFNHLVGVRAAGTVLAVNSDPDAPVLAAADVGIVGDWRQVVPLLTTAIVDAPRAASR